jgi:hypothetical protein
MCRDFLNMCFMSQHVCYYCTIERPEREIRYTVLGILAVRWGGGAQQQQQKSAAATAAEAVRARDRAKRNKYTSDTE